MKPYFDLDDVTLRFLERHNLKPVYDEMCRVLTDCYEIMDGRREVFGQRYDGNDLDNFATIAAGVFWNESHGLFNALLLASSEMGAPAETKDLWGLKYNWR